MKTQISSLINGSEKTIRNLADKKYADNPIGFFSGKNNVPEHGGTPGARRLEIASKVGAENPGTMRVAVNGVELTLDRHNSASGKSWHWEVEITPTQYEAITGKEAPAWTHDGAVNTYSFRIPQDCTVEVYASSGKKDLCRILGEEYVTIL